MVFWGDLCDDFLDHYLYDDFRDHSGLRSGNGAGGAVRFLVCGRRWMCAAVGTSRSAGWRMIVRERRDSTRVVSR